MYYCLQIAEAIDIEDGDDLVDSEIGSNKSDESNKSDSGVDIGADLEFRDCRKLVKFNNEQKQQLKEI